MQTTLHQDPQHSTALNCFYPMAIWITAATSSLVFLSLSLGSEQGILCFAATVIFLNGNLTTSIPGLKSQDVSHCLQCKSLSSFQWQRSLSLSQFHPKPCRPPPANHMLQPQHMILSFLICQVGSSLPVLLLLLPLTIMDFTHSFIWQKPFLHDNQLKYPWS